MRWWVVAAVCAAPALRAEAPANPQAAIMVPYRLTATQHVLVRAKINSKGPFNFILDTGAPALFVARKVAESVGATPDARGWATFDRFEVEGGVVFEPARGKADDLFQLEGMNGMGLAGVELHGVIGYSLLARYRVEYDFTRPKLSWTKLDYEPPALTGIGSRSAPAGLDALGGVMKFVGAMMGRQATVERRPRGFLGAEFADGEEGVTVARVLSDGPAAKAGLKPGDRVRRLAGDEVETAAGVADRVAKLGEGAKLTLTVSRGGRDRDVTVELGKGL
jgi:hypothetical protein